MSLSLHRRGSLRPVSSECEIGSAGSEVDTLQSREVVAELQGISPSDSVLEPYFALAEEFDVPFGLHLGPGPAWAVSTRSIYAEFPDYRISRGQPTRVGGSSQTASGFATLHHALSRTVSKYRMAVDNPSFVRWFQ